MEGQDMKASDPPLLALLADGGLNDQPVVITPAPVTSATLIEAIKTVKAAGYRVKPPKKPRILRGKDRVGPTCVVRFSDGVIVRMSVCTSRQQLDWERGIKLARAAWESRWRRQRARQMREACTVDLAAPIPPPIVAPIPPLVLAARFEEQESGKVLARYQPRKGKPTPRKKGDTAKLNWKQQHSRRYRALASRAVRSYDGGRDRLEKP
jgi:hypothetical protein